MIIYYLMLLILGVASVRYSNSVIKVNEEERKRQTKKFLIFSGIVLTFIAGTRDYSVGSDTQFYVKYFLSNRIDHMEKGFLTLIKILRYLRVSPTIFLIVCSAICFFFVLLAVYRMSVEPAISVLMFVMLYYFFNSLNPTRQYIAIGMILNAYYHILKGHNIRAILLILLASLFHSTAILCLLLFFVKLINKQKYNTDSVNFNMHVKNVTVQTTILTFVGSIVIVSELNKLLQFIIKVIPRYAAYVSGDYSYYLEATGGIQQPIVYGLIFFALIFLVDDSEPEKLNWLFPMSITVAISFLQLKMAMAVRLLWYFDIFSIFAIPSIIVQGRVTPGSKVLLRRIILFASFAFMSYCLINDLQRAGNYKFIFG